MYCFNNVKHQRVDRKTFFRFHSKIVPVRFRKNNKVMKSKQSFTDRILGLQGNLLSFAYQLTTNREQAQDLLQDTTLKALDNEDKYVDNVNFKGWIFTIMRNISSSIIIGRLCARPL